MQAFVLALALLAQETPLDTVAQKLAACIAEEPDQPETLFSPEFLKSVPSARIAQLFKQLHTQAGPCTSFRVVADDSPALGVIEFVCGEQTRVVAIVNIQRAEPHKIVGIRFDPPKPYRESIDDVADEMRKLRGKTSLLVQRIGDRPLTVVELNPDAPLAIGSAFKLYVLAAMASQSRDAWTKTVTLRDDLKSLGAAGLEGWKAGAPITIHTLASLMISRSDNTATDHLIDFLGRQEIERTAASLGNRRNLPFLSTAEAFKLKASPDLRKRWIDGDEAARRKLLAGPVREMSREGLEFPATPAAIDQIEWFASVKELCGLVPQFIRFPETLREILAINPGMRYRRSAWKYVGFKGGSETGVLNATLLLQSTAGDWYTVSATWNDATAALDEPAFFDLVQDVIYKLQR